LGLRVTAKYSVGSYPVLNYPLRICDGKGIKTGVKKIIVHVPFTENGTYPTGIK